MCIIVRNITGVICACAIYKGCGPSARLELPPDDFSRNAPDHSAGFRLSRNGHVQKHACNVPSRSGNAHPHAQRKLCKINLCAKNSNPKMKGLVFMPD